MTRLWRWLFGSHGDSRRELRRDPDLDYVKHIAEDHEYRIQLMERDLEQITGGTTHRTYKGVDRRQNPRH